jgi:predicted histidine transporter YuiF (NhaC family)
MKIKERPILSNLIKEGTLDIEKFQNEVIRPIIKMQHSLLIALFQDYIKQRKIDFINLKKEKQIERINTILTKDTNFKSIILGIVIGHFSPNELSFFVQNSSEFKKRVIQIAKHRLQDNQQVISKGL